MIPPNGTLEVDSPVGRIFLSACTQGLTHLLFVDSTQKPLPAPDSPTGDNGAVVAAVLAEAETQLRQYFERRRRDFDLPLAPRGTPFQLAVWKSLRDIPFGGTANYGQVAERIGRKAAVRAVGAANGANPIAIIVPCHRVIGRDRSLTGYGGGLGVKRALLALEGAQFEGDRLV